jgi:hypothetical protein
MKIRTGVLIFITSVLVLLSFGVASCAAKTGEATQSHPAVPAVPNNSIVTAKVINVQEGEGVIPWVLTIEIQTSQDVTGYPNDTREKIGQQLLVRTMDNVAQLKINQIVTADVRFEGDEQSCFYYIWDIH